MRPRGVCPGHAWCWCPCMCSSGALGAIAVVAHQCEQPAKRAVEVGFVRLFVRAAAPDPPDGPVGRGGIRAPEARHVGLCVRTAPRCCRGRGAAPAVAVAGAGNTFCFTNLVS